MRTQAEIRNHDWFGRLPEGWEMKPLKSLFTFSKGLSITKKDLTESGKSVISYGQIHSKDYFGTRIVNDIIRYVSYEIAEKGDSSLVNNGGFVFADTSEDLAGVGNCAYNDLEKTIYGGYHTIVLNPRYEIDNKFLAYQFRTDAWRHQLRRQLVDVKLFSVNQRILSEAYVVLPPADVRRSIVSFLDARCAPIDEAITRHRQAIDKLEAYRRAVISKAVTKGLNFNASMKDSGIDWIGMIPSSWEAKRIKFVARLASGGTPSREYPEYWDGDIPWVKTGELKDGFIFETEERITDIGLSNSSARLFPKGTLLMAMYGQTRGMTGCLGIDAAINQACLAFTLFDGINPDYFWMALRALYAPIREESVGSAQPNLNSKLISNMTIPVPPLEEQKKIVLFLESRYAAIDKAIDRQRQIISKLNEYRRSLIHAAVTGRIDCTKEPL